MRTYIYVDGFNFYYGAIKGTPYKWLDFKSLFQKLLDPKHQIISIKYFSAHVTGRIDPGQPLRQKTYLNALKAYIPEIEIHLGHFSTHDVIAPLASYNPNFKDRRFFVPIIKTEEKGSDVNLAVHLLNDSWLNVFDCAVVVSNDSDLEESLKIIKRQHKKTIGLINPRGPYPARSLMRLFL